MKSFAAWLKSWMPLPTQAESAVAEVIDAPRARDEICPRANLVF
jgi:hypothetical protein